MGHVETNGGGIMPPRNGYQQQVASAAPPSLPPTFMAAATGPRVFLAAWSVALLLLSAGWLNLPAKDSELKALTAEVNTMAAALKEISLEMRGLRNEAQRNREEFIRFTASGYEPAPSIAPAAAVRRPIPKRPTRPAEPRG